MNRVVLLLGSNLDDRLELLQQAITMIESEIGELNFTSSIYETEPWGYDSENSFLNQAILVKTSLSPNLTLEKCLAIEKALGRTRNNSTSYSDRIIDIDILLYEEQIIDNENLQIPHPRMHQRRFCMEPLNEIVPNMIIPTIGKNVKEVYNTCEDNSYIKKLNVTV